ncbi:OmpA family protein [Actinomadura sp. 9N407]|uniref:OmpA family protein n=1 Tax=Actinomadura sp. 9N407 TaxID=3375154 RepID=UPI0037957388
MPARRLLPAAVAVVMAATGCSDTASPQKVDPPKAGAAGASASGAFTREGWFGGADGLHARVEVKGIERRGGQTLVRYAVTSMETVAKSVPFAVSLLDPVGRKLYRPIAAGPSPSPSGSGSPSTVASPTTANAAYAPTPTSTPTSTPTATPTQTTTPTQSSTPTQAPQVPVPSPVVEQFLPGATRELAAGFPSVPSSVQKLTVLTPGTAGEFTGVPVTGTASAPGTVASPGNPVDLYDVTEGAVKDVTASGSDVKMNLRADVLFATGSAELSGRAKAVLDQAGQEVRQKADAGKGPITIYGHTDSKGSDADNLKLSQERAKAVEKELKTRLGGTYTYTTQGKGEAELIAKEGGTDDANARSRNRRVEISYLVRQQAPSTTTSATAPADSRGGTVPPAAFRAQDGKTVASRYGRFGSAKRRIDVKPFYRDGAYLVAVFDIVNEGPGTTPPDALYPHKDYLGGAFTAFSVLVPGGTDVYRAVRIGPPAANSAKYVDPGRATFRTAMDAPARGFVYIPAPPGNVKSVTFDAGPFGKVGNVPVA